MFRRLLVALAAVLIVSGPGVAAHASGYCSETHVGGDVIVICTP
jgi:hypothetical protein